MKKNEVFSAITAVFKQSPNKLFNYKRMAAAIGAKSQSEKALVMQRLKEMAEQGLLDESEKGKFRFTSRSKFVVGIIDKNNNAKMQLIPEDGGEKIFIADRNANRAMKNDTFKVLLYAHRKNRQPEGEVVEILKRARETFV